MQLRQQQRDLIVERRDGRPRLSGCCRRCPARYSLPRSAFGAAAFPARRLETGLGVHLVVARRMAVIRRMRIGIADRQEKRFGGSLLIEECAGFRGEQVREVAASPLWPLPFRAHARVLVNHRAVDGVPEAKAVLRSASSPRCQLAHKSAFITDAGQECRKAGSHCGSDGGAAACPCGGFSIGSPVRKSWMPCWRGTRPVYSVARLGEEAGVQAK